MALIAIDFPGERQFICPSCLPLNYCISKSLSQWNPAVTHFPFAFQSFTSVNFKCASTALLKTHLKKIKNTKKCNFAYLRRYVQDSLLFWCVHISTRDLGISMPNLSFWEGNASYCKDGNWLWKWEGSKCLICARDSKILSRIFPGEVSALKIAACSSSVVYCVS